MTAMTFRGTGKAALALAVSTALAASLALAAPATAQAKAVKAPAKVKKPTVSKVKATSFKVTWKKAKRAKGYQVKVLKGSRTVKTITVKKRSCYATGLSSKTTYKVKVRAYSQSGKKTKYGKWSAARAVTTAKGSSSSSSNSNASNGSSSSGKKHVHTWTLGQNDGVEGEMKVYYCLEMSCQKMFIANSSDESLALLKKHVAETGHIQSYPGVGFVYEAGIKTRIADSEQTEPYNYALLDNYKLVGTQTDVCTGCGATRAHQHSWKTEKYNCTCKTVAITEFCTQCFHSNPTVEGCSFGYYDTDASLTQAMRTHQVETGHSGFFTEGIHAEALPAGSGSKSAWIYSSVDHRYCTECGLNEAIS